MALRSPYPDGISLHRAQNRYGHCRPSPQNTKNEPFSGILPFCFCDNRFSRLPNFLYIRRQPALRVREPRECTGGNIPGTVRRVLSAGPAGKQEVFAELNDEHPNRSAKVDILKNKNELRSFGAL
jgi:hypothetical protein